MFHFTNHVERPTNEQVFSGLQENMMFDHIGGSYLQGMLLYLDKIHYVALGSDENPTAGPWIQHKKQLEKLYEGDFHPRFPGNMDVIIVGSIETGKGTDYIFMWCDSGGGVDNMIARISSDKANLTQIISELALYYQYLDRYYGKYYTKKLDPSKLHGYYQLNEY